MDRFARIDAAFGRLYAVIGSIVGVTIGLFALAIAVDLGLRLLQLGNLPGMQEIVEYLLYVGVFLAAPWVLRLNAHVRVDLVVGALPHRTAVMLERAVDGVALAVCAVLAWYGAVNMAAAWKSGAAQQQYFIVHEWYLLAVLVLAFVLLAIEFGCRIVRAGPAPEADDAEGGF